MKRPPLALALYATVFLTGAAVLVFEVAAVRLLAPYFGSSLSVLTSVLSVILLALSLGYYFGGRLADRHPYCTLLFFIIATGGSLMLGLLYVLLGALPSTLSVLGLSYGPLAAAILGFFIPALLLGIDSPFVSKILTLDKRGDEGATIGTIFFASTLGSIVGSLSAGFYLIPHFGIIHTLAGVSITLIVWTFVLTLLYYPKEQYLTIILGAYLALGLVASNFLTHSLITDTDIQVLHEVDGLYSHLVVYEKEFGGTTYRFLKNDTNHSSAINPKTEDIVSPYTQYSVLYRTMVPSPRNYLVLGGGAFTVPRHVHADNPEIKIDTVEIEPYLEGIAYEYFGLPRHKNLSNYTMDARVFLRSTTTKYDVIFSDVMNGGHFTPPHLMTREFFTDLRSRLSDDGVVIMNYIGSLDTHNTTLTGSLLLTIGEVFPNYKIIAISDTDTKDLQNLVIVLRPDGLPIVFPDTTIWQRFSGGSFPANNRFVNLDTLDLGDEEIFTDNQSQVENLTAKQIRLHFQ